jgi:hypothetical protein
MSECGVVVGYWGLFAITESAANAEFHACKKCGSSKLGSDVVVGVCWVCWQDQLLLRVS